MLVFAVATADQGDCGPGIQCVYHWKSQLRPSVFGNLPLSIIRPTAFAYLTSICLPCGLVAENRVDPPWAAALSHPSDRAAPALAPAARISRRVIDIHSSLLWPYGRHAITGRN